ncbi:MAG: hypothetical protein LUF92_06430 [Clostridiales bacterium]|nr:hypothetical protein [Clostridiales bacterium]
MLNDYYKETDPIKRKTILNNLEEKSCDPVQLVQLRSLFNQRYTPRRKEGYNDRFLGAWMELKIGIANRGDFLSKKRSSKQIQSALHTLCLDRQDEFSREILYQEMCHMVSLYVATCTRDNNYGSVALGIGRISYEDLQAKIKTDLDDVKKAVLQYAFHADGFQILSDAIEAVEKTLE